MYKLKVIILFILVFITVSLSGCYTVIYQVVPSNIITDYNEQHDYYIIYEPYNHDPFIGTRDYWYYRNRYVQPQIRHENNREPIIRTQPKQRPDNTRNFDRRESPKSQPSIKPNNDKPTRRR